VAVGGVGADCCGIGVETGVLGRSGENDRLIVDLAARWGGGVLEVVCLWSVLISVGEGGQGVVLGASGAAGFNESALLKGYNFINEIMEQGTTGFRNVNCCFDVGSKSFT